MIRVTIEIVPHGDNAFSKNIAGMQIINDLTCKNDDKGNYTVILYPDETFEDALLGRVENWDRKRPVWDLVIEAALNTFQSVIQQMKKLEKLEKLEKELQKEQIKPPQKKQKK